MTEKKSLIAKLAEACAAVGGIDKGGYNEMQRYKYVKAADVAKAIRHEFFQRNIVLTIDEKAYEKLRDVPTKSGGIMPEYLLKCEVTFWDGDSAEKLGPFGAFGVAMDSGDKAIYKAKTGCLKYVLRTIGLIPDEKDDPEADGSVDAETSEEPKAITAPLGNFQKRAWESSEYGKTDNQKTAYLQAKFGQTDISKISKADFDVAMKWLASKESLEDTLRTSVEAVRKPSEPPAKSEPVRTLISNPEAAGGAVERIACRVNEITWRKHKAPRKGTYGILEVFNDQNPGNFDLYSFDDKINEILSKDGVKGKLCIFDMDPHPKYPKLVGLAEIDRIRYENNLPVLDYDAVMKGR